MYKHRIFIDAKDGNYPDTAEQYKTLLSICDREEQMRWLHAHIKLGEEENEPNFSFIAYIAPVAHFEYVSKVTQGGEKEVSVSSAIRTRLAAVALFNDVYAFSRFAAANSIAIHLSNKSHLPYLRAQV